MISLITLLVFAQANSSGLGQLPSRAGGGEGPLDGGVTGTGAAGQVAYWNSTSSITGNNNLFWDNSNSRLGIGTNSPTDSLDVFSNSLSQIVKVRSSNVSAYTGFIAADYLNQAKGLFVYGNPSAGINDTLYIQYLSGNLLFFNSAALEVARFSSTGNFKSGFTATDTFYADIVNNRVGIGTSSPAQALDVTGNVRFSGALMPNNAAGSSGQYLTSAGAGTPPTWTTFSTGAAGDSTGSPGNAVLNNIRGRSSIAAGASSITITNSFVSTSSIVVAVLQTVDATLVSLLNVIPGSGSFVINGNAVATGNTNVGWYVVQ